MILDVTTVMDDWLNYPDHHAVRDFNYNHLVIKINANIRFQETVYSSQSSLRNLPQVQLQRVSLQTS